MPTDAEKSVEAEPETAVRPGEGKTFLGIPENTKTGEIIKLTEDMVRGTVPPKSLVDGHVVLTEDDMVEVEVHGEDKEAVPVAIGAEPTIKDISHMQTKFELLGIKVFDYRNLNGRIGLSILGSSRPGFALVCASNVQQFCNIEEAQIGTLARLLIDKKHGSVRTQALFNALFAISRQEAKSLDWAQIIQEVSQAK